MRWGPGQVDGAHVSAVARARGTALSRPGSALLHGVPPVATEHGNSGVWAGRSRRLPS